MHTKLFAVPIDTDNYIYMPKSFNYAGLNADYSIASQELTVEVPAGMVQPQCINTDIIDDNIAMEGNETFRVMFTGLPEGVFPGGNNGTTVEIVDNDGKSLTRKYAVAV